MKRGWKVAIIIFTLLLTGCLVGVAGFLTGIFGHGFLPLSQPTNTQDSAQQEAALTVPDREATLALLNGTMGDFARAVSEKDFKDFYGNISTVWKKQTTAEKITTAFAGFMPFGNELQTSVESGPTLNAKPLINEKNVLVVQGFYRIEATKMLFSLEYVYEALEWKLLGVDIEVK